MAWHLVLRLRVYIQRRIIFVRNTLNIFDENYCALANTKFSRIENIYLKNKMPSKKLEIMSFLCAHRVIAQAPDKCCAGH